MYNINDYVIYSLLQVCRIENLETPSFESDSSKLYYKLVPAFDDKSNTTIYVPVHSVDRLRPLFPKEQVQTALHAYPTLSPTPFTAKKPPQLTAHYQELLLSQDVLQYLTLLKEVRLKEQNSKKLNEIDVRYRAKTEKLLSEEFALVLGSTPEEILKQFRE